MDKDWLGLLVGLLITTFGIMAAFFPAFLVKAKEPDLKRSRKLKRLGIVLIFLGLGVLTITLLQMGGVVR